MAVRAWKNEKSRAYKQPQKIEETPQQTIEQTKPGTMSRREVRLDRRAQKVKAST